MQSIVYTDSVLYKNLLECHEKNNVMEEFDNHILLKKSSHDEILYLLNNYKDMIFDDTNIVKYVDIVSYFCYSNIFINFSQIIVKKCITDLKYLDALCNYAIITDFIKMLCKSNVFMPEHDLLTDNTMTYIAQYVDIDILSDWATKNLTNFSMLHSIKFLSSCKTYHNKHVNKIVLNNLLDKKYELNANVEQYYCRTFDEIRKMNEMELCYNFVVESGYEEFFEYVSKNDNIWIAGGYPSLIYFEKNLAEFPDSDIDVFINNNVTTLEIENFLTFLNKTYEIVEICSYFEENNNVFNVKCKKICRIIQIIFHLYVNVNEHISAFDSSHCHCAIINNKLIVRPVTQYTKNTGLCKIFDKMCNPSRMNKIHKLGFKILGYLNYVPIQVQHLIQKYQNSITNVAHNHVYRAFNKKNVNSNESFELSTITKSTKFLNDTYIYNILIRHEEYDRFPIINEGIYRNNLVTDYDIKKFNIGHIFIYKNEYGGLTKSISVTYDFLQTIYMEFEFDPNDNETKLSHDYINIYNKCCQIQSENENIKKIINFVEQIDDIMSSILHNYTRIVHKGVLHFDCCCNLFKNIANKKCKIIMKLSFNKISHTLLNTDTFYFYTLKLYAINLL